MPRVFRSVYFLFVHVRFRDQDHQITLLCDPRSWNWLLIRSPISKSKSLSKYVAHRKPWWMVEFVYCDAVVCEINETLRFVFVAVVIWEDFRGTEQLYTVSVTKKQAGFRSVVDGYNSLRASLDAKQKADTRWRCRTTQISRSTPSHCCHSC